MTYTVKGKERAEVRERAGIIERNLKQQGMTGVLRPRPLFLRPELRFYTNREAAAFFGISSADIAENLFVINEGMIAANLDIAGRPLDIRVSGNPGSWNNSHGLSLDAIPIKTRTGNAVFLSSLGYIEQMEADAVLARQIGRASCRERV